MSERQDASYPNTEVYRMFYSAYYMEGTAAKKGMQGLRKPVILQRLRGNNSNDSPDASRASILNRLVSDYKTNPAANDGWVLDLGAGRQVIETELEAGIIPGFIPALRIVTIDIADISARQLLIRQYFPNHQDRYPHIHADGSTLPFRDATFASAISNMALDFMPAEARRELYRVLIPGAPAFLNLHHSSLIPRDLDWRIWRVTHQIRQKKRFGGTISPDKQLELAVLGHDRYLRDHKVLFEDPKQITRSFEQCGFIVSRVTTNSKGSDTWWEVDLRKKDK